MSNEKSHKIDAIKYFVPLPEGDYDFQEHLTDYLLTDILNANKQLEKYEARVKELEEKLKRKTQEYEELKEEISKLQLNEYHYKNELKKYKKGIHKYRNLLRYEINNLRLSRREFLKMVGRYPKFEKDNIKLALDTFNKKLELIDNTCRYRKALDDIQKIALRYVEAQGRYDILDIINKAKGEIMEIT